MALERRNPLPVGRYWIDVFDRPPGHLNDFSAWATANAQKIELEVTEEKIEESPARLFVIFRVQSPVFFPSSNFGFPTIATPDIRTSDDTVAKPVVKEPTTESVVEGLVSVGKFAAVAAGLLLLSRLLKKG